MDVNELVNPKYYCIGRDYDFFVYNDSNNWVHPTIVDMYVDLVKIKNKWKESLYNQPFKKG
jgi:hypothetical protein